MDRREFSFALAGASVALALSGQRAAARGRLIYEEGGIALAGADPVAYHHEGRARAGQARLALSWRGATWVFASEANLAAFEADPRRYAPEFGGFCAFGMSEASLFSPDPAAFALRDGHLYLMNSMAVRDLWLQDPDARIIRARTHWALLGESS